jgi:AcrR family transcriptional regulator
MNSLPRSDRTRTRAAILDAAAIAFRETGFEGTSMDEIALRAGVARGTLYYNFVSKEDIAVGIAERYRKEGYALFVAQQAAGADILTLLDNFFAFAGAWIADNRDAAFIGTTAAIRGVGKSPDRPGTTAVFEALVAYGQAEGVFRADRPAALIARLLAALLMQAALLGPDAEADDVRTWPGRLLRAALEGVLARPDPAP